MAVAIERGGWEALVAQAKEVGINAVTPNKAPNAMLRQTVLPLICIRVVLSATCTEPLLTQSAYLLQKRIAVCDKAGFKFE